MSKRAGVTVDHLLIHCPIAWELWTTVFSLFGVSWVMLKGVVDLLASWQGKFGRCQECGHLESNPSLSHVGNFEGAKCKEI